MKLGLFSLCAFVAMAMTLLASSAEAFRLGAAFATDPSYANQLTGNPNFCYYHTWQYKYSKILSDRGFQWVPMRWGDKKNQYWPSIKKSFSRHRFPYALAYNEPDVQSQSNYSPGRAASAFQAELAPLRRYGTKIGSPQICWDINWLSSFMKILKNKGGHVDFVAIHYYGAWNSLEKFKQYVTKVHNQFGKEVWVTEFGVTTASRPSTKQAKDFMVGAIEWMASKPWIKTAMPFGFFTHPPDNFGSGQVRVFRNNGQLTSIGQYYRHFHLNKRSLDEEDDAAMPNAIRRRHHALLKRLAEADPAPEDAFDDKYDGETVLCDEMCQGLEKQLADESKFDIDAPLTADEQPKPEDNEGIDAFTEEDHLAEPEF